MFNQRTLRPLILAGLAAVLIVLLPGLTQRADAQAGGIPDATVATDQLNLRSAPYRAASVVAILVRGDTLTIDGRDVTETWLHGKARTGEIGWVLRAYLSLRNTLNVGTLPVLDANAPVNGAQGGNAAAPTATAPGAPPAPVVSGSVGRGFELGGQVQGLGGATVAAMQRAHMKWVKMQARDGDGNAVGAIGQVHGAGFKILLSVVGDKDAVVDGNYQNGYAGYVAGLAAAGADAIEIWNEMNIDREWKTGSINPALYVSLLAKSYNAIKKVSPNTIVISGALAPTGAEGAFGRDRVWNDDKYYAGMAAAGAGRYADCIGVHYNEGIVGPTQVSGDPRGDNYPTRYFSTMLSRAIGSFSGKQACFTELGYLTPEGYGTLPGGFAWAQKTTVAQQAAWLAQAAVRASASGRVRMMIIFNVDFTYFGDDPQAGYAIIRPGGVCPACDTLASVMH